MTGVKYLVDTDWIVPALKGRLDAQSLLTSLAQDGLAISLISYGEIYEGICFSSLLLHSPTEVSAEPITAFLYDRLPTILRQSY